MDDYVFDPMRVYSYWYQGGGDLGSIGSSESYIQFDGFNYYWVNLHWNIFEDDDPYHAQCPGPVLPPLHGPEWVPCLDDF